jgi:uncharacterized protein YhbP (UPF0306 family)
MANKEYIQKFLKNHPLAILSTVTTKGLPDAAPIYFACDDDMQGFMFISPSKTQKSKNMEHQNTVVLTITNEQTKETIQIKGTVTKDNSKIQHVLSHLSKKLNQEEDFIINLPLFTFQGQEKNAYLLEPKEIRYRKYTDHEIEEVITY